MKKVEQIYREMLWRAMERGIKTMTQKGLSERLAVSLSTVNHALKVLKRMGSIRVGPRNFKIINLKKILYCWANMRNLEKDVIYSTRVDVGAREIERGMPPNIVFTAYSGYRFKFKDVPADYSEIYVYAGLKQLDDIKKRFKEKRGVPNLFVLEKDPNMQLYKEITLANLFVDIWNLNQWYAKEFLKALEGKIKL